MLWLFMQEHGLLANGPWLLHVAPEPVIRTLVTSAPGVRYASVDLMAPNVDAHMDLTNAALRDDAFDGLIAVHVLEHIPDDAAAMREMLRVLKPGGWALLQIPLDVARAVTYEDASIVDPDERVQHFGQSDHVRWYGLDFADRLRVAGFEVTGHRYLDMLSAETVDRYRLREFSPIPTVRGTDVWFCRRPLSA